MKRTIAYKTVIAICVMVLITTSLTACLGGNKDDTDGVESTKTPGTTTPSTGNDAVSMNALVGTWGCRDNGGEHFYYVFEANGNFTYYRGSTYSTDGLFTRYEFYTKGKYRVKDHVIEFYDCQRDSHMGASWKYFGVGSFLDLQYDIPFDSTPLEDPRKADNATVMFEFTNATTLRIISESGIVWGNYDMDFKYMGNSRSVTVPTHRIPVPDLAWPKNKLPPEVPAYTDGSIREIDDTSHDRTVYIYIERTSREALVDYGERLIQSGWEPDYFDGLLDGTDDVLWLEKDGLHVNLYLRRDDYVEIAFWYEMGVQKYW